MAKTKSVRSAPAFLAAANQDQTQAAGAAVDFQELCAREMDRALGIHNASLDSAVQLHSCAMEFYQAINICNQASWFSPAIETFIHTAAQSFAHCMKLHTHCMDMHRSWLALLAPYGLPYERIEVSSFGAEAAATAEELAYHMDIAIGERSFPVEEAFASHAGFHTGLAAQSAESGMDIAMGSRAA